MSSIATPTVGNVYKFTLRPGYNVFDGVYRVAKLMTYDEYIGDEAGDILRDFYTPNDKDEDDIGEDFNIVRSGKILKLIDPNIPPKPDVIHYVPLYYLYSSPDYHVRPYNEIGIICSIGVLDEEKHLQYICNNIKEQVLYATGIDPKPALVAVGTRWLSDDEYAEIEADRDESKKKVVNYYSEYQQAQQELNSRNTLLKEYEALIIDQQQYIESLRELVGNAGVRIRFDANQGTGEMNDAIAPYDTPYRLPECTLYPPDSLIFQRWNNKSDGTGDIGGSSNESIDISRVGSELTLYAIWG